MNQQCKKYSSIILLVISYVLTGFNDVHSQTASYTSDKTSGCSPLLISFDGSSSTGDDLLYSWDFGNGNSSSGKDKARVGAIYTVPGVYTVQLKVYNSQGANTQIKKEYITVFKKPSPDFKVSGEIKGCVPLNTSFLDQSVQGNAAIDNWTWDFGDGESSILQSPAHSYKTPGKYTVSLIAIDGNGCTNSISKKDYVDVGDKVQANFTSLEGDSVIKFCKTPATINFVDKSKIPAGANPEYQWSFGDGSSSVLKNPVYEYKTPGKTA